MLRVNVEKHIKTIITILISFLLVSCEDTKTNYYEIDFDMRLNVDDNGYHHLTVNRNNWQTLHRVTGSVKDTHYRVENFWVEWESNLYWYLGDTLGYVVKKGLTDDLVYVNYDTTYVTGFSGMEVPTSNVSSVSNSDGEVSNMIAPVQSMIGDTLVLNWVYYDWIYGNYEGEGNISIILD